MSWIILSILVAVFAGTVGAINKKIMRDISEYTLAFAASFLPAVFLFLIFILSFQKKLFEIPGASTFSAPESFSSIPTKFWIVLFIGGIAGAGTSLLYLKLVKNNDLSETLPLLTFTPIFSMIVSPLMLGRGEIPNTLGIIGIMLIVGGAYTINIKERKESFFRPFLMLIKNRGSFLALILAFIYSITSAIDKIGSSLTSSLFWMFCLYSFIFIALLPVLIYRMKKTEILNKKIVNKKSVISLILISTLFGSLSSIFQMTAIQLSKVAYVISIKRTGIILAVFWGYLFFKEKNIKERLFAAIMMILGVIFITLS